MRILIADDQARIRYGLRVLLEQQPGYTVVAEATDCTRLLQKNATTNPDLVLLDWNLPGMPAGSVINLLRRNHQTLNVIVLSGQVEVKSKALKARANAFVSKSDSPEKLLKVIRQVTRL